MRRLAALSLYILLLSLPVAHAQELDCGNPFVNGVGPFDFTSAKDHRPDAIPTVEHYHLNSDVINLVKGQSATDLMEDLDFVLRAVPNHPRALDAVARYELKTGRSSAKYHSAECYFKRALDFKPKDPAVHLVYGIFLARKKDRPGAMQAYQQVLAIDPQSAEAHYNLGLLYFDMQRLDDARSEAERAYELGYPLPGLQRKLEQAGAWRPKTATAPKP
jgi:tetratricopeptide (TPR) repeat protein